MDNISYEVHKEEMERLKYAHEGETAMLEIANKRAYILLIIMFIALILTNAGWIVHESMYEDIVVTENSQDGEGVNIIGGGDVNYGSETDNNKGTP